MNNKESYNKILYIDKEKSILVFIITLIICGVIGAIFKEFPEISSPIYSIIYLVASFIVILLTTSILKVEKIGYYKFVRIIFYCIVIYNAKSLLPKISEPNSFVLTKYTESATISLLMNSIALVFLKISTIINGKSIKNNILYISFFALFIINHLLLLAGKENGIAFFINIINLFLVILITINLKGCKIIKDDELNILSFMLLIVNLGFFLKHDCYNDR